MKAPDWVKALRSGDYEQGKEALCKGGSFCCLGVLCEILELPKVDHSGAIYYNFPRPEGALSAVGMQQSVIPRIWQPIILEDLNLQQVVEDDEGDKRTLHTHLICMNDAGKTFDEIADYIEKVVKDNDTTGETK